MTWFPSPNITSDDQFNKYKMGEACGTLGGEDKRMQIFDWEILKEKVSWMTWAYERE